MKKSKIYKILIPIIIGSLLQGCVAYREVERNDSCNITSIHPTIRLGCQSYGVITFTNLKTHEERDAYMTNLDSIYYGTRKIYYIDNYRTRFLLFKDHNPVYSHINIISIK